MITRLFLLLCLALAVGSPAYAQQRGGAVPAPARAIDRVAFTVLVVKATDEESGVDPRLQSYASSFRYLKYKGYRLIDQLKAEVAVGGSTSLSVEGGRKLKLTLISVDSARAQIRLELSNAKGNLLDTTVRVNRDGSLVVGGPKVGDGMLLLPVRASY